MNQERERERMCECVCVCERERERKREREMSHPILVTMDFYDLRYECGCHENKRSLLHILKCDFLKCDLSMNFLDTSL